MFSYLPPDRNSPQRYQPGLRSLQEHQDNLVTREWLARIWAMITDQKERVISVAELEPGALAQQVGILKGLATSLEVLETIAEEVRNGEFLGDDQEDDRPQHQGSEKVQ